MPRGTLKKFVCLAKTCILTDTPEMSTDSGFVEKVVAQLGLASQHHRDFFTPHRFQFRKGIHVDNLHRETEFLLQWMQRIQQVVA